METSYGWLAILPPLVAIGLAMWKRQVIASLLLGVWCGATIIGNYNPVTGIMDTFSKYIVAKSLADSWNIGVIVFCLGIGGMVGVIGKLGGTKAIAEKITNKAKSTQSTLLATALMGVVIFFDDYANSMIVGNTMRPITDKNKISREKLSYLIDSTAAPVSSMAPLSTWIAMELGLIASSLKSVNIEGNSMIVFAQSVPFRFYSLFALMLLFILIFTKKDFGPMLKAELRSRKTGQVFAGDSHPMVVEDKNLYPQAGTKCSVWDAVIPISLFILITLVGLAYNGGFGVDGKSLRDAYGDADASVVLTWAAGISSVYAIVSGIVSKKLNLTQGVDAWVSGVKTMVIAAIILTLAFALKAVVSDMGLANWLVDLTRNSLSGAVLPTATFLLAMIIAFATGTSWGTNAILMPIAVPVAAAVSGATTSVTPLIIATIGAVLTGAVFGDHCSPISDTTILSSMAAGSDHVDHVKTQIPYASIAAGVALVFGFIPAGLGLSPWISLLVGFVVIFFIVRMVGKKYSDDGEII